MAWKSPEQNNGTNRVGAGTGQEQVQELGVNGGKQFKKHEASTKDNLANEQLISTEITRHNEEQAYGNHKGKQ